MALGWRDTPVAAALATGTIHAWRARLDVDEAEIAHIAGTLSEDERQRANHLKLDAAKRRFIAARGALRDILARYLAVAPSEIQFTYQANGKPQLAGGSDLQTRGAFNANDVQFNLAHSGELALIVVTLGSEVGVDVERLRKVVRVEQIAERYFHPAEAAAILNLPIADRSSAFLQCWTGKEAVLKAVGYGVSGALDQFQVPLDHRDGMWIEVPKRSNYNAKKCWLQPLALGAAYVAAVANVSEERRVTWMPLADRPCNGEPIT